MSESNKRFLKRSESSYNPSTKQDKGLKEDSLSVLEELVQCSICLEKLTEPRMLPCQHTFCLTCLKTLYTAKNLVKAGNKLELSKDIKNSYCPVCKKEFVLSKGLDSLEDLPKNFQAETILKLLDDEANQNNATNKIVDYRCVKCQTVSDQTVEHVCQHCMQVFCSICWLDHMSELDANLSLLVKQIEEARSRLAHKSRTFEDRCDQLIGTIQKNVQQKIENIKKLERNALEEMEYIKRQGTVLHDIIDNRVNIVKGKVQDIVADKQTKHKISNYMNVHRETAKLFEEIYQYGEARIVFDADKICIDQDKEGIYNDVNDKDQTRGEKVDNPFESVSSMIKHYKSRSFVPRLLWTKCPRPGGVGIAPWDPSKIYIAATDTKSILVVDRAKFKLIKKIQSAEMWCPTNLTFSKKYEEIFVTDKWKNCVHVFSGEGDYMKSFEGLNLKAPDGIAVGPAEEILVCDTGNNRVVAVDAETGNLLYVIGNGELHIPTSVAIHGEKIFVADTGNSRIKEFNKDGVLVQEIGAFGRDRGQFRSAEVVAVDCLGFILVGDAGNARIQVFTPEGKLVKIFGSSQGFGWISGIHVTPELDIICTDNRKRSLRIF